MADLFEEVDVEVARFRETQRVKRELRWAEDGFFARRPWRWLPRRPLLVRAWAFRAFGVPRRLSGRDG